LTLTTEDALEVKAAIEKNNVKFQISFPHMCRSELMFAKDLAASGNIGQVTYARVRNVHNGSSKGWLPPHFYNIDECGGGAMVDLGAHPMYLLLWFLGKPVNVSSTFTKVTNNPVEDNAVSLIEFENNAIGVSETGFVSEFNPFTLEVSGTKGTILVRDTVVSYANEESGGEWVTPENLPERKPFPIVSWINSIKNNTETPFGIDKAVNLTRIMEVAYKSYGSNKKEYI
jgi:predicted dehydrogenase